MSETWKNDPRLKELEPERLEVLSAFARELSETPDSQKLAAFLSISQRASAQGLRFTDRERDLLIDILTGSLPPKEQGRARLIRNLASKLVSSAPGK